MACPDSIQCVMLNQAVLNERNKISFFGLYAPSESGLWGLCTAICSIRTQEQKGKKDNLALGLFARPSKQALHRCPPVKGLQ